MYGSYGSQRQLRPRKLFTHSVATKNQRNARSLREGVSQLIPKIVLQAGREALRCAGPGWYPESDIQLAAGPKPLMLRLSGFKRIEIQLNAEQYLMRAIELYEKRVGANPLIIAENTVGAMVFLFAGYYGLCPWDLWRHRKLVRAAMWGAYGSYWVSPEEVERAQAIALFFERSVVAHALTELEGEVFVNGLTWERVINNHPARMLQSLFQGTQALLFPKAWEKPLAAFPSPPDPLSDALLPRVLPIIFGGRVTSMRGRLIVRGRTERPLSWEWSDRVERLAALLAPCLEDEPDAPQFPNPDANPQPGDQPGGTGTGGGTRPYGLDEDPNPFLVDGDSAQPGGSPLPGQGGSLPGPPRPGRQPIPDLDSLDRFYSERACALVVRDSSEDAPADIEPRRIVAGYLGSETGSIMDIPRGRVIWRKTRFGEPDALHPHGLRLFRQTDPLEIDVDADDPAPLGLPHLLICVDSSGSMQFTFGRDAQPSGKYHVVLTAAWGIFKYIQDCPDADRIQVLAMNFSNTTRSSGWQPGNRLGKAKATLAAYQGGGTSLDVGRLREAFDARPGPFLSIVITDGALGNCPAAVDAFRQIVLAGNHVVLLHIGSETPFTKGIKDLGCPVHLVAKAEDLVGLCLDLAKNTYDTDNRSLRRSNPAARRIRR